jgi:hypothetical protein
LLAVAVLVAEAVALVELAVGRAATALFAGAFAEPVFPASVFAAAGEGFAVLDAGTVAFAGVPWTATGVGAAANDTRPDTGTRTAETRQKMTTDFRGRNIRNALSTR